MATLVEKREQLLARLGQLESCAVAFSAGVDSTVVAKAAYLALGDRAVAVTANSPSLAAGELEEAEKLAAQIGIRHRVIATTEMDNPLYVANAADRCFHCKTELYTQLNVRLDELGVATIVNGANVDDLDDYRPGMEAARQHAALSPLADCGFTKAEVRALAAEWDLPVWNKPATPCLSSRIAYGEEVTPQRLDMIDRAEQFLRKSGFDVVRVRYHKGDIARLEVPLESLSRLVETDFREQLISHFSKLGFKYVTLDLAGFRSGSQNLVLSDGPLHQIPIDLDGAPPR